MTRRAAASRPAIVIIGGPNGAGKTTVSRTVLADMAEPLHRRASTTNGVLRLLKAINCRITDQGDTRPIDA